MMRRWLMFVGCLLALVPCCSFAAAGALAVGTEDRYVLSRAFTYLEDRDGQLTFQDILKPQVQAAFRPVPEQGPGANFGLTHSAIWLRLTLSTGAATPRDWLLEVAYPPLDQLEVYTPGAGGSYDRQVGGDQHPFGSRVIAHRNHVLPVSLAPNADSTIYLRLRSEGTVSAPATLWQPAALWRHDQGNYAALSLYFGLLIGLLLYNLLLFISVRDMGYLIYVAFVASMGVGQAALTGLGAQFLWPEWTWWNGVSPPVGMAAAAIFGFLFARNFLSSAVRMPRIDRFMLLQLGGWVLALLAALTLPYAVSSYMVTVLAVVSVATMVVVGVITIRREFAGARFFFTAWALLLAGVVTLALHNTGVLPSNAITANALLIG
ncbi:MAG: 7TM-DISM domain-containing protein, partial [Ramlibacter sp.]